MRSNFVELPPAVCVIAGGSTSEPNSVVSPPATMKSYLWVADPRQVTFLCLSKEKSPKETTPRSARRFTLRSGPLHSSPHRALANSPGAKYAPRAQTRGSLEYSWWGCGTRRARRGPKNTSDMTVFFQSRMVCPRREAQGGVAPSGACFLWFLFLHEQRMKPWVGGGASRIRTRGRRPLDKNR
jgi:hypothetical protein